MASSHADQELITERQAKYEKAYNAADVDNILSFMSEGIEFCDYSNSPLPTSIQSPIMTLTTPTPLHRRRDAQPQQTRHPRVLHQHVRLVRQLEGPDRVYKWPQKLHDLGMELDF